MIKATLIFVLWGLEKHWKVTHKFAYNRKWARGPFDMNTALVISPLSERLGLHLAFLITKLGTDNAPYQYRMKEIPQSFQKLTKNGIASSQALCYDLKRKSSRSMSDPLPTDNLLNPKEAACAMSLPQAGDQKEGLLQCVI